MRSKKVRDRKLMINILVLAGVLVVALILALTLVLCGCGSNAAETGVPTTQAPVTEPVNEALALFGRLLDEMEQLIEEI